MASQRANFDALDKTISRAPFDGLVTNVPVREGEDDGNRNPERPGLDPDDRSQTCP